MQYKISVLIFIRNDREEFLMLQRNKSPNKGLWSPIGGKLEMETGESPYQCAARETYEEIGLEIGTSDLHLFCMIAEKAYEGSQHWLMFLFDCRKSVTTLPETINEGRFAFYSRAAIDSLSIPETDREGLWRIYDKYRDSFVSARADCDPGKPLKIVVEQIIEGD